MSRVPKFITETSVARYVFSSQFVEGKRVLDIGCNCGYGDYLLSRKANLVVGLDYDHRLLVYAVDHFGTSEISYLRSDAHALPFRDASFEVLTSHHLIEHLSDVPRFVQECYRVLAEEGIFICSTPNKEIASSGSAKPRNPAHIHEFSWEEFAAIFKTHFELLDIYGLDPRSSRAFYKTSTSILWTIANKIRIPHLEDLFLQLCSFITRFLFTSYHWVKVEEVKKLSQEALKRCLLRHHPAPSSKDPRELIAVARKQGGQND